MHINTFFKQNPGNKVIWNNIPKTTKNKFVPITTLDQFRKFSNSRGIIYNKCFIFLHFYIENFTKY